MEKDRSSKIIAIVALMVAVFGLSVGFAAFSRNLNITTETSTVNQKNNLAVVFSSSDSSIATDPIVGSILPTPTPTGVSATNATINNGDQSAPSISGLSATFTEPGQSATYTFYVHNKSDYAAYLRKITFTGSKSCTATGDTDQTTVNAACNGISMSIKVGSMNAPVTSTTDITQHSLSSNAPETVTITISYAAGSSTANGDFNVSFGGITLNYSSVDAV